jgi:hypothetical protein
LEFIFSVLIMKKASGCPEHRMFTEEPFFRFGAVVQLRHSYRHILVLEAPLKPGNDSSRRN